MKFNLSILSLFLGLYLLGLPNATANQQKPFTGKNYSVEAEFAIDMMEGVQVCTSTTASRYGNRYLLKRQRKQMRQIKRIQRNNGLRNKNFFQRLMFWKK